MVLHTERLLLRAIQPDDLEKIHTLHSQRETDEFNPLGIPKSMRETETVFMDWIREANNRSLWVFAIELMEQNHFIGLIGLRCGKPKYRMAEVWYKLFKEHWNRGYATEALLRIIDFGIVDLGLHRIEAGTAVDNTASIRVMEKVGMVQEGRKRKLLPLKNGWSDGFIYALLDEDKR